MKSLIFTTLLLFTSGPAFGLTATEVIGQRCMECHNQATWERDWTDSATLKRNKFIIIKMLMSGSMPPQNVTGMTQEERDFLIKYVGSL